jgi:hypothetical protein
VSPFIERYGALPGEGVHVNDVVGLALSPDQGGY